MKRLSKNVLRYFGPYPFNPRLIFIFLTSLYFSRLMPLVMLKDAGIDRASVYLIIFIAAALPAGAYALGAYILERYRPWAFAGFIRYLLEIIGLQVIFFYFLSISQTFLAKSFPTAHQLILPLNPLLFLSALFFALFSFSLSHGSERRIYDRLRKADNLVQKLELNSNKLVLSDETLRRQTSQFLHDKIQSELMVIAMGLKSVKGESRSEVDSAISSAINRLESTRSIELRNLVQILTPNFEGKKLSSYIEVLKRQYAAGLEISIEIDPEIDALTENQQLGLFRIVEQCLLNSLLHGPAKRVKVSIFKPSSQEFTLTVEDDGPGADLSRINSGMGSAIIDSWVNILKGASEISTSLGSGYRFKATFHS